VCSDPLGKELTMQLLEYDVSSRIYFAAQALRPNREKLEGVFASFFLIFLLFILRTSFFGVCFLFLHYLSVLFLFLPFHRTTSDLPPHISM
jgi:hypothetical protein